MFGRFKTLGVDLSIDRFRSPQQFANALSWFLPLSFTDNAEDRQRLKALFDLGNRAFKPFYAYGDDVAQIASKKKSSGSVDIQSELPGVFWLTYFNAAYVAFFGDEKFNGLPGVERRNGSITIVLGESPRSVANDLREQVAVALGKKSFVDRADVLGKPLGRFALTFQQLSRD